MARRAPWNRWRSVAAGGSLLTFLAPLRGTWGQGQASGRSLTVGEGLTLASVEGVRPPAPTGGGRTPSTEHAPPPPRPSLRPPLRGNTESASAAISVLAQRTKPAGDATLETA